MIKLVSAVHWGVRELSNEVVPNEVSSANGGSSSNLKDPKSHFG
jgi:hypothetical protein